MELDAVEADPEAEGDLLVREPLAQKRQYLPLPRRQHIRIRRPSSSVHTSILRQVRRNYTTRPDRRRTRRFALDCYPRCQRKHTNRSEGAMSLHKLRIINCIAQVLVLIGVLAGAVFLVDVTDAIDSSLVVSLGLFTFMGAAIAVAVARGIRKGRSGSDPSRATLAGFGVLIRTHHNTDPISLEESEAVLQRLFGNPLNHGTVVQGARCRDCGHEEVVLQNVQDELFLVTGGVPLSEQRMWIVGLFGMWHRADRVLPLATRSADA